MRGDYWSLSKTRETAIEQFNQEKVYSGPMWEATTEKLKYIKSWNCFYFKLTKVGGEEIIYIFVILSHGGSVVR